MEVLFVSNNIEDECYDIFIKFGESLYILDYKVKIHKLLSKKVLKELIKSSRFYRVSSGFDFKSVLSGRRIIKVIEKRYDRDSSYSI